MQQNMTNAVVIKGAFTDTRVPDTADSDMLAVLTEDGEGIVLTPHQNCRSDQIVIVLSGVTLEALGELVETGRIS